MSGPWILLVMKKVVTNLKDVVLQYGRWLPISIERTSEEYGSISWIGLLPLAVRRVVMAL
jgi:hypothetical protein